MLLAQRLNYLNPLERVPLSSVLIWSPASYFNSRFLDLRFCICFLCVFKRNLRQVLTTSASRRNTLLMWAAAASKQTLTCLMHATASRKQCWPQQPLNTRQSYACHSPQQTAAQLWGGLEHALGNRSNISLLSPSTQDPCCCAKGTFTRATSACMM